MKPDMESKLLWDPMYVNRLLREQMRIAREGVGEWLLMGTGFLFGNLELNLETF